MEAVFPESAADARRICDFKHLFTPEFGGGGGAGWAGGMDVSEVTNT